MDYTKNTKRIAAVIELLLMYHPMALRILAGEHVPDMLELADVKRCATSSNTPDDKNIKTPHKACSPQLAKIIQGEDIQNIIDAIGGWGQLSSAACYYKLCFPTTWSIFVDYVMSVSDLITSNSRTEPVPQIDRIAQRYNITRQTVCKKRKLVPEAVARYALFSPPDDLTLLSRP